MCCVSNELVNLNGRDCKKTKAINTHNIFVRVMYFFMMFSLLFLTAAIVDHCSVIMFNRLRSKCTVDPSAITPYNAQPLFEGCSVLELFIN